jgi:RNA polymerase sigma factor (TIGR02999 family)
MSPALRAETEPRNCHGRGNLFSNSVEALTKSSEITGLLKAWGNGDEAARDRLAENVYDELRRIARHYMKDERAQLTLQTTALVNEVYLRLVDTKNIDWQHRSQFFSICAQMMRRILVDAARARSAAKRGSRALKLNIEAAAPVSAETGEAILALHDALETFAQIAHRQSRVVELRYFGGLSVEEVAGVMNISQRTVMRDWDFAKIWLARALSR